MIYTYINVDMRILGCKASHLKVDKRSDLVIVSLLLFPLTSARHASCPGRGVLGEGVILSVASHHRNLDKFHIIWLVLWCAAC